MTALENLRLKIFGPRSKFKVRDTVQLKQGKYLMVVIEVINKRGMKRTLLNCQWYEPDTKQNRTNLFSEVDLIPFDWYRANSDR